LVNSHGLFAFLLQTNSEKMSFNNIILIHFLPVHYIAFLDTQIVAENLKKIFYLVFTERKKTFFK